MFLIIWNWLLINYVELIGAVAGILGVWLTSRENIWCWPIALVNVVLYIYVFFIARLYADVGLQIFYLVMTLYGWYSWKYGGKGHVELSISRVKWQWMFFYMLLSVLATWILGYIFSNYTNASYPYWDSFVSVWGIIGTYMMARKVLEHWIVWIIVDLICVCIYYQKGLYPTTLLYFVFAVLALWGFIQWKKKWKLLEI